MRSILILFFLALYAPSSQASAWIRFNCALEVAKFCTGVDKDRPYICMKKHPEGRSKKCDEAFQAYEKEFRRFYGPCLDNPKNPCAVLEPGEGMLSACYARNRAIMTKACLDYLNSEPSMRYEDVPLDIQQACSTEVQSYCATVQRGRDENHIGRMWRCLIENKQKLLAPACIEAVGEQSVPEIPPPGSAAPAEPH